MVVWGGLCGSWIYYNLESAPLICSSTSWVSAAI